MDRVTAKQLNLALIKLNNPSKITAADGGNLGKRTVTHTVSVTLLTSALHREEISFLISTTPKHPNILGNAWLKQHDPVIPHVILHKCRALMDVFSKVKATGLPPHRDYDCKIKLMPGTQPPYCKPHSASQMDTTNIE